MVAQVYTIYNTWVSDVLILIHQLVSLYHCRYAAFTHQLWLSLDNIRKTITISSGVLSTEVYSQHFMHQDLHRSSIFSPLPTEYLSTGSFSPLGVNSIYVNRITLLLPPLPIYPKFKGCSYMREELQRLCFDSLLGGVKWLVAKINGGRLAFQMKLLQSK